MLYLGVDGGGTKTAFSLIDEYGRVILEETAATCYIPDTGEEAFIKIFLEFEKNMKQTLGKKFSDLSHTFLGMPGFNEISEWDEKIIRALDSLFTSPYTCANDCVAGWAGSLAARPGINVVAGTGAIAFAVNEKGEQARVSGWGPLIGDEGSGYWLGIQALRLFSKQSDGRTPKSLFYSIFKETLKLKKDQDLLDLVYNQWAGVRAETASLSKIVYEAALQNDLHALDLINCTVDEIFSMIEAAIDKLLFEGSTILSSYSGGIFNMGHLILNPLKKRLEVLPKPVELRPPALSPVHGAALYAAQLDGVKTTDGLISRLGGKI